MTHTKGPWEAHNGEVTTRQAAGRSYRRIAAVQDYGLGSQPEVDEANARLIAAAPRLLAALEEIIAHWRNSDEEAYCSDLATDAINAIREARGEVPAYVA